ncbi:phosphodiester glycosidase family protein [Chryseobacterium sp. JV558]|uniref:phosphodiester glycosidase family protein n=1 Tax=Chryseobacterium sp. JV558 TaxID=2663236 RepID=UPI00299EB3D5|nr:phosphodiester glycosidase family protein [Chryseobacterium sp. JV558]MDW9379937.1 hypothetical protein [Chryseobacterium sp. JV558]
MLKSTIPFLKIKPYYLFLFLLLFSSLCCKEKAKDDNRFITYQVNPEKQNIQMYWKNDNGELLKSLDRLNQNVQFKNEKLIFAMNGGMFEPDNAPKGLYIEDFKILKSTDTLQGNGNFYLQPNGVFYLTQNNQAGIVETKKFRYNKAIRYATQSGPMLITNGKINPIFEENSKNLNIRNGVGILENGDLIFVMSKKEVNFYTLAEFFKNSGCKEALYLDGYVSRTYLPEKNWIQKDGNFGVMIGVTTSAK